MWQAVPAAPPPPLPAWHRQLPAPAQHGTLAGAAASPGSAPPPCRRSRPSHRTSQPSSATGEGKHREGAVSDPWRRRRGGGGGASGRADQERWWQIGSRRVLHVTGTACQRSRKLGRGGRAANREQKPPLAKIVIFSLSAACAPVTASSSSASAAQARRDTIADERGTSFWLREAH